MSPSGQTLGRCPKFKRSRWQRIVAGNGLDGIGELNVILPGQLEADTQQSPERLLWISVLAQAITDLTKKKARLVDNVEDWVLGESAPIPFSDLCDRLNLDKQYSQSRLLAHIAVVRAAGDLEQPKRSGGQPGIRLSSHGYKRRLLRRRMVTYEGKRMADNKLVDAILEARV